MDWLPYLVSALIGAIAGMIYMLEGWVASSSAQSDLKSTRRVRALQFMLGGGVFWGGADGLRAWKGIITGTGDLLLVYYALGLATTIILCILPFSISCANVYSSSLPHLTPSTERKATAYEVWLEMAWYGLHRYIDRMRSLHSNLDAQRAERWSLRARDAVQHLLGLDAHICGAEWRRRPDPEGDTLAAHGKLALENILRTVFEPGPEPELYGAVLYGLTRDHSTLVPFLTAGIPVESSGVDQPLLAAATPLGEVVTAATPKSGTAPSTRTDSDHPVLTWLGIPLVAGTTQECVGVLHIESLESPAVLEEPFYFSVLFWYSQMMARGITIYDVRFHQ